MNEEPAAERAAGESVVNDQEVARGPETFPSEREYRLHCLRHSAAHLLAAAVQQLYPEAKFGVGPPVKDRFYYDLLLPHPLSPDDLGPLEARMRDLAAAGCEFRRETWGKREARDFFEARGQSFKVELIEGIDAETVSIYHVGDFTDLCAGPHVGRASECAHFKLTAVSGSYWRGDETKPALQRVYGTVWPTGEELEEYLRNVEEARRRDHRRLGRELGLFTTHEWAPGAVFWLPKGTVVYRTLQEKMRQLLTRHGYVEVKTPVLANAELFKKSGHWEHYRENMFVVPGSDEGGAEYGIKPMNCPGHMLVFGSQGRSYRELPLRLAEQTVLHRNEQRGALSGLTRVRQFQQDDAHIFLAEDHLGGEVGRILALMSRVYRAFDMPYRFVLSTRNEKNYTGELALWEKAERALQSALEANGLDYEVADGEAAFYGPKIDQLIQDSLKREHQLGTIQADFQLPRKFELSYVGRDGGTATPVVIHRAIYGSLERFIAVLIEHYAGAFPTWLAPVQAKVLSISEKSRAYALRVCEQLLAAGLRAEVDAEDDKIGNKIRVAHAEKVPYMLVVGSREAASETVSVRSRERRDESAVPLDEAVGRIVKEASFDF
jgi:threonyl-tRNA synthetase